MQSFATPIFFTESDEVDLVDEEHPHVAYRLVPSRTGQPITNGRLRIEPVIDLDDYRAHAVIDWIDLAFRTTSEKQQQAVNIHNAVERNVRDDSDEPLELRVEGPQRQYRYLGDHFILRVQEPTPALLERLIAFLHERYQISGGGGRASFEIPGIEISVDIYPRLAEGANAAALALRRWSLSEVLRKHLVVDPAYLLDQMDAPRFVDKGERTTHLIKSGRDIPASLRAEILGTSVRATQVAAAQVQRHRETPLDGTYYVGSKDGPVLLRLQDKTADRRNGAKASLVRLPAEKRRSRIEVCLEKRAVGDKGGPALVGLNGLDDLYGFNFARIRKPRLHFEGVRAGFDFALPTIDPRGNNGVTLGEEVDVFRRTGVYGLDQYQWAIRWVEYARWEKGAGRRPNKLGRKGYSVSYGELNTMVTQALRVLGKRWQRR